MTPPFKAWPSLRERLPVALPASLEPLVKIWLCLLPSIVIAYLFLDRPICEFVYHHAWPRHLGRFEFLSGWPPVMTNLAPFFFFASFLFNSGRTRRTLLLMSLSILLTFVFKNDLKWVFSRYWPLTWNHDNPSWILNHAYGFQWFQGAFFEGSDATGSFPSGHTAIAFASLLPIGLMHRRLLPYCCVLAAAEGLSMVAYDYHFLSDVFAGALVGMTCALVVNLILPSQLSNQEPLR